MVFILSEVGLPKDYTRPTSSGKQFYRNKFTLTRKRLFSFLYLRGIFKKAVEKKRNLNPDKKESVSGAAKRSLKKEKPGWMKKNRERKRLSRVDLGQLS